MFACFWGSIVMTGACGCPLGDAKSGTFFGVLTFGWIALNWVVWSIASMVFRASEPGLIIGGAYNTEDSVVTNLDVYMPLTSSYMDTIAVVYFSVMGSIVFLQICVAIWKHFKAERELVEAEEEERVASLSGLKNGSQLRV